MLFFGQSQVELVESNPHDVIVHGPILPREFPPSLTPGGSHFPGSQIFRADALNWSLILLEGSSRLAASQIGTSWSSQRSGGPGPLVLPPLQRVSVCRCWLSASLDFSPRRNSTNVLGFVEDMSVRVK